MGKNFYRVGKKDYKNTDESISFNNKTFPLPKDRDTYRTKKESFVYFNYDSETIIRFGEDKFPINLEMLDAILSRDFLVKMSKVIKGSMDKPEKLSIFRYIIPFVLGLVIGILVMMNPEMFSALTLLGV